MRAAVAVGILDEVDAADGIRVRPPHGDARKAHCELGSAVQSAAQRNELTAARRNLSEECGSFVRLCASGAEKTLLQVPGCDARQLFREVDKILREVDVADMLEGIQLLCDGGVDLRIAVAAVDDGDTGEAVEILPSFAVIEILHLPAHDLARLAVKMPETGHDVFLLFLQDGGSADV